jgi:hypothetical protein
MLFLRLTPLIPNWFVNVSSPIVGMPFAYFFFGTLLGKLQFLKQRIDACKHNSFERWLIIARDGESGIKF